MEPGRIYFPEDRLPFWRLLPLGMQHVVAMFGATVLAPMLMGFNAQTAVFFSGIGTLIFLMITGFRVPSYLGSSFAFIGPVLAVTGGDRLRTPQALCGIAGAAVLYGIAAAATLRWGPKWIDRLMPPVVTGSVVALIGLNLAGSAIANVLGSDFVVADSHDVRRLLVAAITFAVSGGVAVYTRGFLKLLPILVGVVAGYVSAAWVGELDHQALAGIATAAWIGKPPLTTPVFDPGSLVVIAPVFVVLVAENKGHIAAISGYMGRDLMPYLGRAYLGDAAATFVSAMGGGTPQTTYAENMGVMAITRVFSSSNFLVAAVVAVALGICPKFGAAVQSTPVPVLGGVSLILYGLITLMGVKIWLDARVDFSDPRNLVVAGAALTVATGLGVKGITLGEINLAGIAVGTVLALALNALVSFGRSREGPRA